ncbi:lecithin retinol acyltransferase family protein [Shewanella pneumatophori]|uniref:Lecithin retinol acyltransferase family protein n=1 Tax=Shewanella pneumatophori TaxID=314092 RepID=A0A9X1ZJK2_9GAMM|nr:lecithin retinol acyltransferase family protein [Shewanella pneumatophori]MCL1140665.1 lecithin retinol acyltransferase family protein [Shewanella pneumatophori]
MAFPLIWLGVAAVGAALVAEEKEKQKNIASKRRRGQAKSDHVFGESAELVPSLWGTDGQKVRPVPGSIVCCFVYGVIEHTGIWIGDDTLVELHGSGLVRAVSARRFLAGRSGSRIYQAGNHLHQALVGDTTLERAKQAIFSYREYDVFDNNCHRFVWQCVSGEDITVSSFGKLNNHIGSYFSQAVYWDEIYQ